MVQLGLIEDRKNNEESTGLPLYSVSIQLHQNVLSLLGGIGQHAGQRSTAGWYHDERKNEPMIWTCPSELYTLRRICVY